MSVRIIALLYVGLMFCPSMFAWADAPPIEPGLWEYDVRITVDGKTFDPNAEMQKMLQNLPADQRAQAQQMMEQAGGSWDIPKGPFQECYTQEDINNNMHVRMAELKQCTFDPFEKTKTTWKTQYTCKEKGHRLKGDLVITFQGTKQYKVVTNTQTQDGKALKAQYDSQWLRASCEETP